MGRRHCARCCSADVLPREEVALSFSQTALGVRRPGYVPTPYFTCQGRSSTMVDLSQLCVGYFVSFCLASAQNRAPPACRLQLYRKLYCLFALCLLCEEKVYRLTPTVTCERYDGAPVGRVQNDVELFGCSAGGWLPERRATCTARGSV